MQCYTVFCRLLCFVKQLLFAECVRGIFFDFYCCFKLRQVINYPADVDISADLLYNHLRNVNSDIRKVRNFNEASCCGRQQYYEQSILRN